jgi:hypothetical protein
MIILFVELANNAKALLTFLAFISCHRFNFLNVELVVRMLYSHCKVKCSLLRNN